MECFRIAAAAADQIGRGTRSVIIPAVRSYVRPGDKGLSVRVWVARLVGDRKRVTQLTLAAFTYAPRGHATYGGDAAAAAV